MTIDNHFALYGIPCDHHEDREYRIPKERSHSEETKTKMDWVTQAFSRVGEYDTNEGRDLFGRELYRAYDAVSREVFLPINFQQGVIYMEGDFNDEIHIRSEMDDQYMNVSMGDAFEPLK